MINRSFEDKINDHLFSGKALIFYGPRQVGKTTLITSILEKRSEKSLTLNADEQDIRDRLYRVTSTKLKTLFGNHLSF
jgi:predicted AAA+ superfamily ATPase